MRIDRMLAITVMLLNRGRISARELASKFEVSIRTIYRDIDALNLAGIPVISYPGNDGGFGIMENFKLDRQVLTLNDMFTILSALKGINTGINNSEIETAIEKIKSLVPDNRSAEMELHFEQLAIDFAPWGFSDRQKIIFRELQRSVRTNSVVRTEYSNIKGESSIREVEPMTLILAGHRWYLFAYCRARNGFRVFRLSRIKNVKALAETFTRKEASYRDYMEYDHTSTETIDLALKFSPDAAATVNDYFSGDQIETLRDGFMIVKVSWPEDEWVYSTILGYGERVEVLEPPHIRKIISEKAKKILNLYKPDILLSQG